MARKFDEKQQAVLDCEKPNQLVSAGAGSGKTTVMIKKISDLLLSRKAQPKELVVLTFTNLASNEMKQRLKKSLQEALQESNSQEEANYISNLLDQIDLANVDTIDGFASKMCKKYFYKLNLSPEVNVVTGLALDYYRTKALDLTIEEELLNNQEQIVALSDCFEKTDRSLDGLKKYLLNAFYFVMAQVDYVAFLDEALKEYLGLNKSADFLNNYLIQIINNNCKKISENIIYLNKYEKYYNSVNNYLNVLNKINLNNNLLENINLFKFLPKIEINRIKEEDKYAYEQCKTHLAEISDIIKKYTPLTLFDQRFLADNSKYIDYFISLLKSFINQYQKLKATYKAVDFADLERNLLKLLSIDDIKEEIYNEFTHIFVDEYQDINPMQNEIILKLKSDNANIFFVGDVKQSIYGFRQSTPELFLQMYKDYKKDNNSETFDMNINFRSNPAILEFNNAIFNHLMTLENSDINYFKEAQFEPKREDFASDKNSVEIAIFNSANAEEEIAEGIYSVEKDNTLQKSKTDEAEFIADKILSMVGKPFYDSSLKQEREMTFSDITILASTINDSKTNSLLEVLRAHNIPINISNKIELSQSESLNILINFLKAICNLADDSAYVNFLTSNFINLSFEQLLPISKCCKSEYFIDKILYYKANFKDEIGEKLNFAFNLIDEIKIETAGLDNIAMINFILNHYHLKQYIANAKHGQTELTSLNNFISTLTDKEAHLSLEEFIKYILVNFKNKTEYAQSDANNSVTIQTIHASKGLEFPVVILFNANKKFRPNDDKEDINFDSELGIGMQYYNLDNRTRLDSLPRFAITLKNKIKCYKEQLRLLYVATTRPQNKLIITGHIKFDNLYLGKLSNNNFLELIYSVFKNKLDCSQEKTELQHACFYHFNDYQSKDNTKKQNFATSFSINTQNLNYLYPNQEKCSISLKNNVTAISKQMNEEYNILPKRLTIGENLEASQSSTAELGTLYHKALSEINFTEKYKCPQIKTDYIDEKLLKLAHEKISVFCKDCINIKQEAPFMLYIPYNTIYIDSEIEDRVLVQGVIDMLIEFEDHFVLIDFKHSKLPIKTLKEKYSTQLALYKLAIEKAYKKPVKNSFIYKINSGEII